MLKVTKSDECMREVQDGDTKYVLEMDKGSSLWSVRPPAGFAPVPLRGKYTTPVRAMEAIKNYLDGAPARSIIYKNVKKPKTEEG